VFIALPNAAYDRLKEDARIHLTMFLARFDQKILDSLESDGIDMFQAKSGLIIYLPEEKQPKKTFRYKVPEYLENGVIRIVAGEEGGRFTDENGGQASVITDESGNMLSPFRISGNPEKSGKHAFFFSPTALIRIKAMWGKKGNKLTIKRLTVKPSHGNVIALTRFKLHGCEWSMNGEKNHGVELPEKIAHFRAAVNAAIAKSLCADCTDLHFAMVRPRPRART